MAAKEGLPAPDLKIAKWMQGPETNIRQEKGKVIFIHVFQVNCAASFLHGIPKAIEIYNKYHQQGLVVWGLATAFEHYHTNNIQNLELLLSKGQVQGAPHRILSEQGILTEDNTLPYKINFPVAMDLIIELQGAIGEDRINSIALAKVPNYAHFNQGHKAMVQAQIRQYQLRKQFFAETLEEYALKGTPSSILVDKQGILQHTIFGYDSLLEQKIQKLLTE